MRNYSAVIRLARFKVEELQKQMATLDASRADLQRQVDQLAASVPEEQVAANASKEGFVAYGSYAQAVIVRKQNIRGSIDELEAQAGRLRAELEKAFAELKKFEIMEERRVAALKAERDKRDQAAIDEIAQRRRAVG
jgi:flagellar export protein FliJ